MKHFKVSISNRKSTGENDASSTKHFIMSVVSNSNTDSVLAKAVDEIVKMKSHGLVEPISWGVETIEVDGDVRKLGKPIIANDEFQVRQHNQ